MPHDATPLPRAPLLGAPPPALALALALALGSTLAACPSHRAPDDAAPDVALPDGSPGSDAADVGPSDAPAARDVVGPTIVSTSRNTATEGEPVVAAAPDGHTAVAWIGTALGTRNIYYRLSRDHGTTWGDVTAVPLPADNNVGADPSLAARPNGTLLLGWASQMRTSTTPRENVRVWAAVAPPGALRFDAPVRIAAIPAPAFVDQPHVAYDGASFYMVYTLIAADRGPYDLVVARSADGAAWTEARALTGAPYANFARMCGVPGRVYLTYAEGAVGSLGITLRWSDDGGATWPAANRTAVQTAAERDAYPALSAGCVARGDEVWLLYGRSGARSSGPTVPYSHVRIAHSGDRGATIDLRTDAFDDATEMAALFPDFAVEPSGAIDVMFYLGTGNGDANASYVWRRSTDGGRTWAPDVVVQQPLLFTLDRTGPRWPGDYMGVVFASGSVFAAYADNHGTASHIAFYRSSVP